MAFVGTRTQLSSDKAVALADVASQNIDLVEKDNSKVEEYLCSVLSTVQRLPPFEFRNDNGHCYLDVKTDQEIVYFSKRKMSIIPMMDPRV